MLSRLMTVREQLLLAGLGLSVLIGSATLYYLRPTVPGPILIAAEGHAPTQQEKAPAAPAPLRQPPPPAAEVAPQAFVPPASPPPQPEKPADVTVAVEGAVRRPGVYTLSADSRISDLLRTAGGLQEVADVSDINLVAKLMDSTTLTIPFQPVLERGKNTLRIRRPGVVKNPPQYTRSQKAEPPPPAPGASTGPPPSSAAAAAPHHSASGGSTLINVNTANKEALETLPGIGPALADRIIAYREKSPFATVDGVGEVSGIGEKRLEAIRPLITVQ